VEVSNRKGIANQTGPEPCVAHRVFSLTPNRTRHPLGVSLRTFDKGRSLCPPATQTVTGDSEKSHSRSEGDKPS
jgi:hypothetical protein